jgi:hypothetical protein
VGSTTLLFVDVTREALTWTPPWALLAVNVDGDGDVLEKNATKYATLSSACR